MEGSEQTTPKLHYAWVIFVVCFLIVGCAVGTPVMNYVYDVLGTYTPAMLVLCGLMAVVAVVMQLVITAAHKERKLRETRV